MTAILIPYINRSQGIPFSLQDNISSWLALRESRTDSAKLCSS